MWLLLDRPSKTGREIAAQLPPEPEGGINWTGSMHHDPTVLNWASRTDKLGQLIRLEHQGVKVPPYALSPRPGWLPRTRLHQQGRDFTRRVEDPDFWVKFLDITEEWRLHYCRTPRGNIRLLRSGVKVPKEGAHPFVRSHRLGWRLSYTGGAPKELQELGRAAIAALQLDFGGVDLGLTPEGPVVLEVNTCPGLDSGTQKLYLAAWEALLAERA